MEIAKQAADFVLIIKIVYFFAWPRIAPKGYIRP